MSVEQHIISKSSNGDIRNQQLRDAIPESLNRAYVYKVVETNINVPLFIPGGKSLVRVDNNSDSFLNLKDDNGDKFIDIVLSSELQNKLRNTPDTQTADVSLKYEKSIRLYTNAKFKGNETERFVFTIGRPYDFKSYADGQQVIYTLNNVADLDIAQVDSNDTLDKYALDDGKVTELILDNVVETLTSIAQDTEMYPVITTNPFWQDTNELVLTFNKEIMIGNILGKGTVSNNNGNISHQDDVIPINFVSETPLTPIKVQPTKINDKVDYYHDWADLDSIIQIDDAKKMIGVDGVELADMGIFDTEDRNLIKDALLFTYAAINQYNAIARNENGKFDPKFKIGISQTPLSALLDSNDIQLAVNKLVETYLYNNPAKRTNGDYQKVSSFLAGLSRYVRWQGCIAKGNNPINEVYLPWYVDLAEKLELVIPGSGQPGGDILVFAAEPKFKLKSKWFEIDETNKDIKDKTNIDLSEQILIQSERKMLLDQLDDQFTTSSLKTSINPGDISSTSTKDLNYILNVINEGNSLEIQDILSHVDKTISYIKGQEIDVEVQFLPEFVLPTFAIGDIPWTNISGNASQVNRQRYVRQLWYESSQTLSTDYYRNLLDFKGKIYDQIYHFNDANTVVKSNGFLPTPTVETIQNNFVKITGAINNRYVQNQILAFNMDWTYRNMPLWNMIDQSVRTDSGNAEIAKIVETTQEKLENYYKLQIADQLGIDLYYINKTDADYFNVIFPDLTDENNWERTTTQLKTFSNNSNKLRRYDNYIAEKNKGRVFWPDQTIPTNEDIQIRSNIFTAPNQWSNSNVFYNTATPFERRGLYEIPQYHPISEPRDNAQRDGADIEKYVLREVSQAGSNAIVEFFKWRPKGVKIVFPNKDFKLVQHEEGKVMYDKSQWLKQINDLNSNTESTITLKEEEDDVSTSLMHNMTKLTLVNNKGTFVRFENSPNGVLSSHEFQLNSNKDETLNKTEFIFV